MMQWKTEKSKTLIWCCEADQSSLWWQCWILDQNYGRRKDKTPEYLNSRYPVCTHITLQVLTHPCLWTCQHFHQQHPQHAQDYQLVINTCSTSDHKAENMMPSHYHLHHKSPQYAGLFISHAVMAHLYVQTIPSYCYNHFHLVFCPRASFTYWWLQSITFMAWNSASELYAKWHWQDYLLECNILKSEVPWNFARAN